MRKFCFIEVKEETSGANMMAILLVTAGITISMTFFTLNLIYLLRDPKYFAISDADKVTEITSTITLAALILSLTLSVFLGQLYDILGRRCLILVFFVLTLIMTASVPYLSPSLFLLTLAMMILQLMTKVLNANPLIPDYVEKTSIGKGVLFHYVGVAVGEIICTGIIFRVSASWDIKYSFFLAASFITVITVLLFFAIREVKPELRVEKGEFQKMEEPMNFCDKVGFLSRRIWQVLRSDVRYIYCLLSYMAVNTFYIAASLYLILWITSFVDSGYFSNEAESKTILSTLGLLTLVFSAFIFPLFGVIVDKVSSHVLSPLSSSIRPIAVLLFIICAHVPDSWITCLAMVSMTLGTFLQSLVTHKLFLYELP